MTLPGFVFYNIQAGHSGLCDHDNCQKPAVGCICVEADSFGEDWAHYCEEHLTIAEAKAEEPVVADCEWCKATNVEVFPTRCTDEGSHGPVYDVCKGCREKQIKRDMEEMEQYVEIEDDSELYAHLDDLRAELSEEEERERQEAEWREEAEQERALQAKMVEKFMDLVKRLTNVNVTQEQLVNELGDTILADDTVVDTLKESVLRLEAIALMQNAIDEIDQFTKTNTNTNPTPRVFVKKENN